jgi:hypothetical protein
MMDKNILKQFREYGKRMKLVAIFSILETFLMVPPFNLIVFIYSLKALNYIEIASSQLEDNSLSLYHEKSKRAAIIRFAASFIVLIWLILLVLLIFTNNDYIAVSLGFFTLIGFGMRISYGLYERKASKQLLMFFQDHQDFPYAEKGIKASKKLKTAGAMEILTPLAITLVIGWIYKIVGYFQLSSFKHILKDRQLSPSVSATFSQKQPIQTEKPTETKETIKRKQNYCPFCGAAVKGDTESCENCGSPLKKGKESP